MKCPATAMTLNRWGPSPGSVPREPLGTRLPAGSVTLVQEQAGLAAPPTGRVPYDPTAVVYNSSARAGGFRRAWCPVNAHGPHKLKEARGPLNPLKARNKTKPPPAVKHRPELEVVGLASSVGAAPAYGSSASFLMEQCQHEGASSNRWEPIPLVGIGPRFAGLRLSPKTAAQFRDVKRGGKQRRSTIVNQNVWPKA